jgi:hypothetical protein
MTNSIIYYVLESTVCLLLFLIVYRLLFANLTHFSWMRVYLLISVILSLVLPLIIIPIHWRSSLRDTDLYSNYRLIIGNQLDAFSSSQSINSGGMVRQQLLPILIIGFYVIGLLYKSYSFIRNLRSIRICIRQNPKVRDGRYWYVNLNNIMPPFSFFNYIFITNSYENLSADELQRIKDHEKIHARELHSLDVIFIELISILFWFNPLLIYLKKSIQEIHEYIVDEKIVEKSKEKKNYAELLLKLASEVKGFNLSAGFSGSQIKRRIVMISKQRSLPGQKLMFVLLIPLTLLLMLSFSYIKDSDSPATQTIKSENIIQNQLKIGKITWKGNTVYDVKTLNDAFGLKEGSVYNKELIEDRLNGTSGARDPISTLYQDNGYLFSRISFTEEQNKNAVDLTISIYEGKQAKFGDIIIKVNGIVTKDGVDDIGIKKGDLFSKAKIIKSIRALAGTGKYDPEKINPKPIPHITTDEYDIVDMVYELAEISTK